MDTSDIEKRNVQPAIIECCYENVKKLRLTRYMITSKIVMFLDGLVKMFSIFYLKQLLK